MEQTAVTAPKRSCDAQTQWSDPTLEDHAYSKGPTIAATTNAMQPPKPPTKSVAESLLRNDTDSLLYTGIPLLQFKTLVSCLQGFAPSSSSMPAADQILMTLMKLRQNFVMAVLARQFHVSDTLVSKTVGLWIDIMGEHCKILVPWLPRDVIKATSPPVFRVWFPDTTCVIDCTETVLQKPKNLDSRSECYSHYYSNNTVKYLVATACSGVIIFISEAYGGKCSDRYIVRDSGFLDLLRCGDEVMGDRGFTIRDWLEERRVNLIMPPFTRKGCQLTNLQITRTRRIGSARIHVERAIRRLKVYRILSQRVPISLVPKIDKILTICAGLVNLRGELIASK